MAKARGGLASSRTLQDDGSEDEVLMPTPDSARENIAPARKTVGRPSSGVVKASKPKDSARGANGASADAGATVKRRRIKRAPLQERTNIEDPASDIEEVDEFEESLADKVDMNRDGKSTSENQIMDNTKRGRPPNPRLESGIAATGKIEAPLPRRGRPPNRRAESRIVDDVKLSLPITSTQQETPELVRQSKFAPKLSAIKKPKVSRRAPTPVIEEAKAVPETQPEPMEIDLSSAAIDAPLIEESFRLADTEAPAALPNPRQRQTSVVRRRGGSASDTERNSGSDPITRRKLSEMTKKFEASELKYQNLREISVRDAESNFEKLKRQSDEKSRDAEALISSLRTQLKTQSALASESKGLRAQLATLTAQHATVISEKTSLSASLAEANTKIQTVSAKLAASRSASTTIQSASDANTKLNTASKGGPGSAVKPKTLMLGSADAARDAMIRQLKEDLYSDLTGLIIRGVKRDDAGDVYDCLQTGRNGTLHFHLTLSNTTTTTAAGAANTTAPSASQSTPSYDDAEFAYTPLLDENRDRELLEILPDYLTEEICFPRSSAGRFYARVVDCLVRRRERVGEEGELEEA